MIQLRTVAQVKDVAHGPFVKIKNRYLSMFGDGNGIVIPNWFCIKCKRHVYKNHIQFNNIVCSNIKYFQTNYLTL